MNCFPAVTQVLLTSPLPRVSPFVLHHLDLCPAQAHPVRAGQKEGSEKGSEGPGGGTGEQASQQLSFPCSEATGSLGNPSPRRLWNGSQSVASPLDAYAPCPAPRPKQTKRQDTASPCSSTSSSRVSQPLSSFQVRSEAPGGQRAQWWAGQQLAGESEGGPKRSPPT